MTTHADKIVRITEFLRARKSKAPLSLKKKSVSHEVPKPQNKKYTDEKIDLTDLNEILEIDVKKKICVAEPGVTFFDLVTATLEKGLVPITVPELETITIGGAVAGCSIESMSYKHGGFHDNCIEYEVITAKGDVLTCSLKKNRLIFEMMHGTFGTLGIISKLTFNLVPAKNYVHVEYYKYGSIEEYKKAIMGHFKKQDIDFMDGIIHSPTECVLSIGTFVSEAPYTHSYDWMRIYYLSTASRKEDYLKTKDYFFRYNKGVTNVIPKSFLGRLIFGKFVSSTQTLKIANKFHKFLNPSKIPVTVDLFIPFSKVTPFMDWYEKEVNHFPLWCVPYRLGHRYEWVAKEYYKKSPDEFYLDLAIYGMRRKNGHKYYKIIEDELTSLGAIKTLISTNHYTEKDFWKTWNKPNFDKVKKQTDPDNIFRGLYEKMCKASLGKGR